jgi:hypothetical protein
VCCPYSSLASRNFEFCATLVGATNGADRSCHIVFVLAQVYRETCTCKRFCHAHPRGKHRADRQADQMPVWLPDTHRTLARLEDMKKRVTRTEFNLKMRQMQDAAPIIPDCGLHSARFHAAMINLDRATGKYQGLLEHYREVDRKVLATSYFEFHARLRKTFLIAYGMEDTNEAEGSLMTQPDLIRLWSLESEMGCVFPEEVQDEWTGDLEWYGSRPEEACSKRGDGCRPEQFRASARNVFECREASVDEVEKLEEEASWRTAEFRAYEEVRAGTFWGVVRDDTDKGVLHDMTLESYHILDGITRERWKAGGGRAARYHPLFCEQCDSVHCVSIGPQWCQRCVDDGVASVDETDSEAEGVTDAPWMLDAGRCKRDFFWCEGCRKVTFADGHDIGALDGGLHGWPASRAPASCGWRVSARQWTAADAQADILRLRAFMRKMQATGCLMREDSLKLLLPGGPGKDVPERSLWGTPLTGMLMGSGTYGDAAKELRLLHFQKVEAMTPEEAWNRGVAQLRGWAYVHGCYRKEKKISDESVVRIECVERFRPSFRCDLFPFQKEIVERMPLTHDEMIAFVTEHPEPTTESSELGWYAGPWEYPRAGFDLEASKAVVEEIIALAVSPLPLMSRSFMVATWDYTRSSHMPDPIWCGCCRSYRPKDMFPADVDHEHGVCQAHSEPQREEALPRSFTCKSCGTLKPRSQFWKETVDLYTHTDDTEELVCLICNPAQFGTRAKRIYECPDCRVTKPFEDFDVTNQKYIVSGHKQRARCEECCTEKKRTCRRCGDTKATHLFAVKMEADKRSSTGECRRLLDICLDCKETEDAAKTSEPTCGSCGRKAPEAERNWNNAQGALWYHEFKFNLYAGFQYLGVG